MAKDPAFLFYPNDWLGGTMGMTFEEKGAYMELLMLQFNRGHMTNDMIGRTVGQLWVKIKDKFIQDLDGLFYNERLDTEKDKRKSFTDSRKNNRNGVNQYTRKPKIKSGHVTKHTTSHMENEDRDVDKGYLVINNSIDFEIFWNLYDKREGRATVKYKWDHIDFEDQSAIIDHVPKYVAATPDKKYRKLPLTYLNQKTWLDEDLPSLPMVNGVRQKPETEADRAAHEFMETVKAYNTHKTLYGEQSANEKFNMNNGNVQSSIDNKRIA